MSTLTEVRVPDIGGAHDVLIIDVAVKPGDTLKADATMITLESDKASMDIPLPQAGTVKAIKVKVGDRVSEGDLILTLESAEASSDNKLDNKEKKAEKPAEKPIEKAESPKAAASVPAENEKDSAMLDGEGHAGPAVRRLARELGVSLSKITGTGRKGRILPEDIHAYVKSIMQSSGGAGAGLNVLAMPVIDFAKFGEVETKPLSRIKKITGANLHRNWVTIPHVTQFDEADITEMEVFRRENKAAAEKEGVKLTPLVFIMKAVEASLKAYPQFNASLDPTGEQLIFKKYFHIGVAVDTPNGLVVPVIRDVDKKGIMELAKELAEVSKKARDGKLLPGDMQGGCFSISSLGGIGGTAFTPIVNAPEVAILGVSRSEVKPKFIDDKFEPRLMLPLSLSYDHRVIDGADGARFITHLADGLADLRRLLF